MSIAKKIHLVFLRKDEIIPPLFKECERMIRDMHPSWNITLWDEETGTQFLRDKLPERSAINFSSQQEILDITGPGLLTDINYDNTETYFDITLLRNEG